MDTSLSLNPLGFAGSLASGIFGAIGANKQIKAQAKENQKNREYNLMLARLQNQWNLEQWQRENDYNSPTAQMARYRQAGLNPDLIYGQQNLSASSPTLTSGAPSTPQDMSPIGEKYRSFGEATKAMAESQLLQAQIDNLNADTGQKKAGTDKTIVETEALTIDNLTRAARNNQALQIGDTVLILNKKAAALSDVQKENLIQTTNNLKQVYDNNKLVVKELRTRIKGMELDNIEKFKETIRRDKRLNAELRKFYDEHRQALVDLKISEQEFSEAIESWSFRLAGLALDNDTKRANLEKLGLENIRLDFENDKLEVDSNIYREILAGKVSPNKLDKVGAHLFQIGFDILKILSNVIPILPKS
jgi:hypothetical protein